MMLKPPRGSIARCLDIFKNRLSLNDFSLDFKEFAACGDWQSSLRLFNTRSVRYGASRTSTSMPS